MQGLTGSFNMNDWHIFQSLPDSTTVSVSSPDVLYVNVIYIFVMTQFS